MGVTCVDCNCTAVKWNGMVFRPSIRNTFIQSIFTKHSFCQIGGFEKEKHSAILFMSYEIAYNNKPAEFIYLGNVCF